MARAPPQKPLLGLELKARFAAAMLDGEKTVELRRYAVPADFLGRPVLLLATPDGSEGRSTLPPDVLPVDFPGVRVAGRVVFSRQVRYTTFEQFAADERLHRVPATGSPYGWQPGVTRELFGWVVERCEPVDPGYERPGPMRRVLSSWFEGVESGEPLTDRC